MHTLIVVNGKPVCILLPKSKIDDHELCTIITNDDNSADSVDVDDKQLEQLLKGKLPTNLDLSSDSENDEDDEDTDEDDENGNQIHDVGDN